MDLLLGVSFENHRLSASAASRCLRRRTQIALSQTKFQKIAQNGPALRPQFSLHLIKRSLWMALIPGIELVPQILGPPQKLLARFRRRLPRT
jgi:hypothetical protein